MPYSSRTGYIIKVQGNSYPEYDSAVHFTLTNASAPLGQETEIEFTIDQVSDNRYLVWVALLRDALVHHLVVDVGYYYAAAPDPGIGKVTYVRLISDPCGSTPQGRQGFTTQKVKAKLTSLTLNQFIVEYEAKTSFLGPCLGMAKVEIENSQDVFELPIIQSNLELIMAQIELLSHAYISGVEVLITYESMNVPEFPLLITGVCLC